MGKVTSLIEFNGGVGNLVGYKGRDGRNVIRHKVYDVKNPKTTLQMRRRVAWGNLVQMWGALMPHMEPAFENKTAGQTQFNAFMQANVDGNNVVYLKKNEMRLGVCLVAPVLISEGTLPAISASTVSGGRVVTNIALGDLANLAESTVSSFSKAILNNNVGWREGDQLTIVYMEQMLEGVDSVPKAVVHVTKIVLQKENNTSLADACDITLMGVNDGYLAFTRTVTGGLAYIQSRKEDGTTKVSTTRLMVNNTLLESYCTRSAQDAAIKSYGGANEKYLTPITSEYLAPGV